MEAFGGNAAAFRTRARVVLVHRAAVLDIASDLPMLDVRAPI
jgi:hypothetical protein